MAERNLLFTWDLPSFDENLNQSNDLLPLRHEFVNRNFPLSRSLLMQEEDSEKWSLVDFKDKKVYHFEVNENEVEVLEEIEGWGSIETNPRNLLSSSTVYGTHEGFIDWLLTLATLVSVDQYSQDNLKRTDLSGIRLSFEIVNPDLLTVHEMLEKIVTAPRESLIGLSKNNLQRISNYLRQLLDRFQEIYNFNPPNSDLQKAREEHKGTLQEIVRFCDEVRQQLGPIVAYLQSKRVEQLETRVNATIDDAVNKTAEKFSTETNRLQKHSDQAEQNEAKRQEDFNQLKGQLEDTLAEGSVSKYEKIFEGQANKHQQASFWWLLSTVGLIIVFGGVFYWLFNALKLGGTEWVGVLQNIFTKGFLLSLIYLVLNRSIKNYTAEKHLEVVNRHRQNALRTFQAFHSAAGENQETQDAVLLAATNAIFDANQSGYLSTKMRGTESVSPIPQVIKAVMPSSSSTRSE